MRVVQLLPELNEGGVERGVVELNEALVGRGTESIVISNGGKLAPQITAAGGAHYTLNIASKNPLTALARAYKLRQLIKKIAPDIVHIRSRAPAWLYHLGGLFDGLFGGLFSSPRAKSASVKIVSTIHGLNSPGIYSSVMMRADLIVVSGASVRDYIIKYFGADSAKIRQIPRGVDMRPFEKQNIDRDFIADFRTKWGLKKGDFIVSSVGRITELKDCETILRATALLKAEQMPIKTLFVGGVHPHKTAYFERLQTLIKELGVQNEVIFAGSNSKIAEIYTLSSVAVSASKKPETFGRSVAEAIAANTPVVATDHGGVKDIIKEGQNGLFFAISDAAMLAEMIKKAAKMPPFDGFSYIKDNFSKELFVARKIALYEELLNA